MQSEWRGLRVVWGATKEAENLRKHGLSLSFGLEVLEGAVHTFEDSRRDYGESRFVTFGYIKGRLYVAVHTSRSNMVRIISVRKANARERIRYG
ncbi:MAG: BrnT family toxin [Gammaproteobacteria bacterium]|nr:BrnT family toxin [Gammaproteobacteria bacterium]